MERQTAAEANAGTSEEIPYDTPKGVYDFKDLPKGASGGGPLNVKAPFPSGAKVKWDSNFWGFNIYLNREAVAILRDDAPKIVAPIVALLPTPINLIVGAYLAARATWAVLVAHGGGVKFHSLWITPGLLTPSAWDDGEGSTDKPPPPPKTEDTYLYCSSFDPGKGWGDKVRFLDKKSYCAPALMGHDMNNAIVRCVFRGDKGDESLYYLTKKRDDESKWVTKQTLPVKSSRGVGFERGWTDPTVVHRGAGSDSNLRKISASWDGPFVGEDEPLLKKDNPTTDGQPAFWEQNVVFRGSGNDQQLYSFHLVDISHPNEKPQKMEGCKSSSGAALTGWDNDHVVCVYRGPDGDEHLYWVLGKLQGQENITWGKPQKVPGASSAATPALEWSAYYEEGGVQPVLCAYRGAGSDEHLYWTMLTKDKAGTPTWTASARIGDAESAEGPALVDDCYFANGQWHTQFLCVYRGHGLR
ncbi:hypothetical protein [Streptomyces chrestomyceticus]|uniref:hypothetical protein n=1 Tax=Streptomyces chrestomyceticus TaxID=68185 RepID=UPI00379637D1